MENEIIERLKHIKNISKKKVTAEKISSFIKKKNSTITQEHLIKTLDTMVKDNLLQESGSGTLMVYSVSEENDNCFVPDTQDVTVVPNSQEVMLEESISDGEPASQGLSQSFDTVNIWNEISNFKKFQMDVERKLCVLEDAVITIPD